MIDGREIVSIAGSIVVVVGVAGGILGGGRRLQFFCLLADLVAADTSNVMERSTMIAGQYVCFDAWLYYKEITIEIVR